MIQIKSILGILFCGMLTGSCSSGPEPREPIDLEWQQEESYSWAELPVDSTGQPGFNMLASSMTGITFNNTLSEEQMASNRVLLNGSGVAAGDVDGDGFVDLYFARLDGPNVLYKNNGGFSFKDITDSVGVTHEGYTSTGAVFADVDGDEDLDLLVTSLDKENTLYLNDGSGHFQRSENSGLGPANGSTTMTLTDIDNDSDLDLYIANYKKRTAKDQFDIDELGNQNMIKGDSIVAPYNDYYTLLDRSEGGPQRREIGEKDYLYLNDGDGTYTNETDLKSRFRDSKGNPLGLERDFGLTTKFGDLNKDGAPDLYVNNDFWTPDRVWVNQGDGTFRALDTLAIRSSSYSSMVVDFSDINHDSYTDIFVVEMLSPQHELQLQQMVQSEPLPLEIGEYHNRPRYSRNSLYLNRGDHTYAEASYYSGLEASDWSWGVRFMDLDLDGYEDVVISTGFAFDLQDMDTQRRVSKRVTQKQLDFSNYILQFPKLLQQNKVFRNNHDLTFTNKSSEWGFNTEDISQGMAVADLDRDGDLEVIMNRMNDQAAIYENTAPGNRIAVRLIGKAPNTRAIGANVELQGGPTERQEKQVISGGDYVSGSDLLMTFAADPTNDNHRLIVQWPDGTQSQIDSLQANRVYRIDETEIEKQPLPEEQEKFAEPLFRDITNQLDHAHHEDPYNDMSVQPLLPIQLSRLGPGMAWFDINQDGSDELIIGTGKGGELSIFEQQDNGQFASMDLGPLTGNSSGDLTGITAWIQGERTHLVVGLSNFEIGTYKAPSALHAQLEDGELVESARLPGVYSVTGPLAAADYTGDGFVDLFVGGRFLPTQYPRDASSRLFFNQDGTLKEDQRNTTRLNDLGLVTGALFVDYNNSGEQDLIVSTEWGSLHLFVNENGQFTERTSELGLDSLHGWWQGIASGDFNNDGYADLVVANRGQNSSYQIPNPEHPLKLFYGEFEGSRNLGIIESYYDQSLGGYVPARQLYEFKANGGIFESVQSNIEFATSTLQELLGRDPEELGSKKIDTVQHMIFMNDKGQGFEPHPLPMEAQLSAGFDVSVTDMDNDGNEDLFLSQNFFALTRPQQKPRMDAGRGLWLRGDGQGNFEAVPGHYSGVKIYGEQRGAVVSDFNGDGRVDLAVSQNGSETRLFVNQVDKRGIPVRLIGPPENSTGIGSNIRLVYADGSRGPARNIQAGSGYWSLNSSTQVMGYEDNVEAIEVHWFDGSEQTLEVEAKKWNYEIYHPAVN